jgi:hypothetical protein
MYPKCLLLKSCFIEMKICSDVYQTIQILAMNKYHICEIQGFRGSENDEQCHSSTQKVETLYSCKISVTV